MRFRVVSLILLSITSFLGAQETQRRLDTSESTAVASTQQTGGGNTGTNRDLLSLFAAALQSYSASGGQALTFDYKIPGLGKSLAANAQLVLRQPQLNEKFLEQYADQADVVKNLENELSYGDDLAFTLTIGPTAKKAEEKIQKAFQTAATPVLIARTVDVAEARPEIAVARSMRAPATVADVQVRRQTAVARSMAAVGLTVEDVPAGFGYFDAVLRREPAAAPMARPTDAASRGRVEAAMPMLREIAISSTEIAEELADDIAVLAANQSKFTLDASYRDRQEAIGPKEWFVKTTYEWGVGTNIAKRLEENNAADCATKYRRTAELDEDCQEPYARALKEAVDDPDVKMGSRVTFALEYHDLSEVNLTQPVTFNLKGSRSLVYSLVAGRDLLMDNEVDKRGRIELSISYDDVTDDNEPEKARKDRFIGKLTYSQRINDQLDIPISLTYANHSDYLTDVDRKLNAHFGISYKLPDLGKSAK